LWAVPSFSIFITHLAKHHLSIGVRVTRSVQRLRCGQDAREIEVRFLAEVRESSLIDDEHTLSGAYRPSLLSNKIQDSSHAGKAADGWRWPLTSSYRD
jgi:hypothetical protein